MGFLPGASDTLPDPGSWALISIRQRDFWKAAGNFDPLPCWTRVDIPVVNGKWVLPSGGRWMCPVLVSR